MFKSRIFKTLEIAGNKSSLERVETIYDKSNNSQTVREIDIIKSYEDSNVQIKSVNYVDSKITNDTTWNTTINLPGINGREKPEAGWQCKLIATGPRFGIENFSTLSTLKFVSMVDSTNIQVENLSTTSSVTLNTNDTLFFPSGQVLIYTGSQLTISASIPTLQVEANPFFSPGRELEMEPDIVRRGKIAILQNSNNKHTHVFNLKSWTKEGDIPLRMMDSDSSQELQNITYTSQMEKGDADFSFFVDIFFDGTTYYVRKLGTSSVAPGTAVP